MTNPNNSPAPVEPSSPEAQNSPEQAPKYEVIIAEQVVSRRKKYGDSYYGNSTEQTGFGEWEEQDGILSGKMAASVDLLQEKGFAFSVSSTHSPSKKAYRDGIASFLKDNLENTPTEDLNSLIHAKLKEIRIAEGINESGSDIHRSVLMGIAGFKIEEPSDNSQAKLSWFNADNGNTFVVTKTGKRKPLHYLSHQGWEIRDDWLSERWFQDGEKVKTEELVSSGKIDLKPGEYEIFLEAGPYVVLESMLGGSRKREPAPDDYSYLDGTSKPHAANKNRDGSEVQYKKRHKKFHSVIRDQNLSMQEKADALAALQETDERMVNGFKIVVKESSSDESVESDSSESQKTTYNLLGALAATGSKVKSALSRNKPGSDTDEIPNENTNQEDEPQTPVEENPEVIDAEIVSERKEIAASNSDEEIPEIEIVEENDSDSEADNQYPPNGNPAINVPIPRNLDSGEDQEAGSTPLDSEASLGNPDPSDPNSSDPNSQPLVPRSPETSKREKIAKQAKKLGSLAIYPILIIPRGIAKMQSSPENFANKFKSEKAKKIAFVGAGVLGVVGIGIAAKYMFFGDVEDSGGAVPAPAESSPTAETTQTPNPEPTPSDSSSFLETSDPSASESEPPQSSPSPSLSSTPEADNGSGVGNQDERGNPNDRQNSNSDGGSGGRDEDDNQNRQPTTPSAEATSADQRSWSTNAGSEASSSSSNPHINQEAALSDSKKLYVTNNGNEVVISTDSMTNQADTAILTIEGKEYQIPLEDGKVAVDRDTPLGQIIANDSYESLEAANTSNNTTTVLATDLGSGEAKAPEDLRIDELTAEEGERYLNDALADNGLGNYHTEITDSGDSFTIQILDQANNPVVLPDSLTNGNDDYTFLVNKGDSASSQVSDWLRRAIEGLKQK